MALNFAHRGFSGKYPENTMLAFEKAVEAGCDGIELDVQRAKDGVLVIIHDETVNRTTDGKGPVADYTFEQLRQLDASGKWKGKFGKHAIPSLEEYFEFIRDKNIWTNIELKNGYNFYPGMEEQVLKLIDSYRLRKKVLVSSFNHHSALRFKQMAPDIPCGFLEESVMIGMPAYAKAHGMDFVHPVYTAVTNTFIKEAQEAGIGINTWTVNKREDISRLLEMEVHGIISNHPDICKELIEKFENGVAF